MELEELYREYGRLMVQAEYLQAKLIECKKAISAELNKPKEASS